MVEKTISALFDLSHTAAREYLAALTYPWEALSGIGELIVALGKALDPEAYEYKGDHVWISKQASVSPSAQIGGPCLIGHRTEVRQGAFIRGAALIGEDCVIGNATELKNAILFDGVQVPHYNYVGDSILGYKAHMGAGAITGNVKSDKTSVHIKEGEEGEDLDTGRKKVGAALGDFVEIGCNAVLNPGTVIGRRTTVYPLSSVRGVIPSDSIHKRNGITVPKK